MEALTLLPETIDIPLEELIQLAAVDSELYCRAFFPQTYRQPSPALHKKMWNALENPNVRLLNMRAFRGSAKTTILRTFVSKRIAYGISRTILFVGASERDSIRSLNWLRNSVTRNRFWSNTFGLSPGLKWQETEIEIKHSQFEHPIWVVGAGMTGSLRGINFDDYRPDLIVLDDPLTDENAATGEQREKISNLVMGALKNSLAPRTEEPNAKLAMLATPQHIEDITSEALKDNQWTSLVFPCWTEDTIDLPIHQQESSWEERYPSIDLRADKIAQTSKNKLHIFTREMECRLVSAENAAFRPSWVSFYDGPAPLHGRVVIGIDPVPPPSDREISRGMSGKDFEAITVWSQIGDSYYLLDYALNNGHEPNWTLAKLFEFHRRYRAGKVVVESVNYQRVLKWIIEQEMKRRGIWMTIVPFNDRRSKYTRIVGTLEGIASNGKMLVAPHHTEFVNQFQSYPSVDHDDLLDSSAIALSELVNPYLEDGSFAAMDSNVIEIDYQRSAP